MSASTIERSAASKRTVAADLLRVYPRLLRWQPIVGAALLVMAVVWWKYDLITSSNAAVWLLRFVGLVLVAGAVFLLDDASSNVTNSSPTTEALRSGLRLILMGAVVFVGLSIVLVVLAQRVGVGGWWWGVTLEVAAMFWVGAAFSLTMQRSRGMTEPGQFAGMAVLAGLFIANIVGARWPMLVVPGPEWAPAHLRWVAILLLAVLIATRQLRDPAARGLRSLLGRS